MLRVNKETWQRIFSPSNTACKKLFFFLWLQLTDNAGRRYQMNLCARTERDLPVPLEGFLCFSGGIFLDLSYDIRLSLCMGKTEICFWTLTSTVPCSCQACKAPATLAYDHGSAHILLQGSTSTSAESQGRDSWHRKKRYVVQISLLSWIVVTFNFQFCTWILKAHNLYDIPLWYWLEGNGVE